MKQMTIETSYEVNIKKLQCKKNIPYTGPSYIIVRVWHSNTPRLLHTGFFEEPQRNLRDYGHVSLETYEHTGDDTECTGGTDELEFGDQTTYNVTYMSLWKDEPISTLKRPFKFTQHSKDIETLHRNADVSVRLEGLNVNMIITSFRQIHRDCLFHRERYKHSILHAFGWINVFNLFQCVLAKIKITDENEIVTRYCCSTFIEDLLNAGGMSTYFRWCGVPYTEQLYRGIRQAIVTAPIGALGGWLGGRACFYQRHRLIGKQTHHDSNNANLLVDREFPDDLPYERVAAHSGSYIGKTIIFGGSFLLAYLFARMFKNYLDLEQNNYYVTTGKSICIGTATGMFIGFLAGILGFDMSIVRSPSYIADLVLSAQKIEETHRLIDGDTRTENLAGNLLKLVGYR